MKGSLMIPVLKALEKGTAATIDLLDFLGPWDGGAYSKMHRSLYGPVRSSRKDFAAESKKEAARQFYNLLYRLRQDGLIERDESRFWSMTAKGKEKLEKLLKRNKESLPKKDYKLENDKSLILVVFDIPEKMRPKRNWLRDVLLRLNFSMLQKSVWLGRGKLPQSFITDLKEYGLLSHIEILSIAKAGTITRLSDSK